MQNEANQSIRISLSVLKKMGVSEAKQDMEGARNLLKKAEDDIDFMQASFILGKQDWASIAGYHAYYHAVVAALLSIGLRPLNEDGAIEAFRILFTSKISAHGGCRKYAERALSLQSKYGKELVKAKMQRDVILQSAPSLADYEVCWISKSAPHFVDQIIDWINER